MTAHPPAEVYATVFEQLHIGIKVWQLEDPDDPGSLRLIASNNAASAATGVRRDLVMGKAIAESFPQAVPDGIAAAFADVVKTGTPKDMGEIVYSDPRVREGVFSIFAFPVFEDCVAVAFENITRRKWEIAAIERRASFVQLLQRVALSANEATSPDEAFQQCLDDVCAHTGWPVGHVYRRGPTGTRLTPTDLWHIEDPERFGPFRNATMETTFEVGEGLPGRVWTDGKPHWMIDVAHERTSGRFDAADAVGLNAGFAFPVMVQDEVAAVLEFFSPGSKVPDDLLLEVMEHVGVQLGRVIERERATSA